MVRSQNIPFGYVINDRTQLSGTFVINQRQANKTLPIKTGLEPAARTRWTRLCLHKGKEAAALQKNPGRWFCQAAFLVD